MYYYLYIFVLFSNKKKHRNCVLHLQYSTTNSSGNSKKNVWIEVWQKWREYWRDLILKRENIIIIIIICNYAFRTTYLIRI